MTALVHIYCTCSLPYHIQMGDGIIMLDMNEGLVRNTCENS